MSFACIEQFQQELHTLHVQCQEMEHELKTSALIGQQLLHQIQVLTQENAKLRFAVGQESLNLSANALGPDDLTSWIGEEGEDQSMVVANLLDPVQGKVGSCQLSSTNLDGTEDAVCVFNNLLPANGQNESWASQQQGLAEHVCQVQEQFATLAADLLRSDVNIPNDAQLSQDRIRSESLEAKVQELQERVSELEEELEDEQECGRHLSEQVAKLERKHREVKRHSQKELLGVVEESDEAQRKLESDFAQMKARFASEQEQYLTRSAELEQQLSHALADGGRYHCQLLEARESLSESRKECQTLQERLSAAKGPRPAPQMFDLSPAPSPSFLDVPSMDERLKAATFDFEAETEQSEGSCAHNERVEELQNQVDDSRLQLEEAELKISQLEVQCSEAENLVKDLQARLRVQGAAHVEDLEYLAEIERRTSSLLAAAGEAVKAKEAELQLLRKRCGSVDSELPKVDKAVQTQKGSETETDVLAKMDVLAKIGFHRADLVLVDKTTQTSKRCP